MSKKITYLELLQLIKECKAPKEVLFMGHRYHAVIVCNATTDYKCVTTGKYLSDEVGNKITMMSQCIISRITCCDPLLDKAEKRYLEQALRPYKDRIKSIILFNSNRDWLYILVEMENFNKLIADTDNMVFPSFKPGTMYTGMKPGKAYTPHDLGLWE